MKVFEANISQNVADYLLENLKAISSFEMANQSIYDNFRILEFFESDEELADLKNAISKPENVLNDRDRAEYGDFQTNEDLAQKATIYLENKGISPQIVIEPTCGKGNFIVASLKTFSSIKKVFGVEIYKPYVWETKFNIIHFYLENPNANKPEVSINHCDVFDFDFKQLSRQNDNKALPSGGGLGGVLIIGNPPWVTNSKLGSLNSLNLPKKSNFKNHNGLDAMTGKGNFDIAEFITLKMLDIFQNFKGNLMLLVKNSVIKNILFEQQKRQFAISQIEKQTIDSKKEFNVSVEASLFYCQLNSHPEYTCKEFDFYNNATNLLQFGWSDDKFVSNIDAYSHTKNIDGECPFEWRQGLKHDCSDVMELDRINGHYVNGLSEEFKLEDDLVYGILKSSDLKKAVIDQTRKFTIVTQKKVGQETQFIKNDFPKTYQYLIDHQSVFEARKSSIYLNKPAFSIFGIGDYSFKPYKIAISGLYKTFHFSLILPQNEKPIMLDDTCYLLGFENIEFAVYTLILLNSKITTQFLQSITFSDAKRTFTKDVLMRIDLMKLANLIEKSDLEMTLNNLNEQYNLNLTLNHWDKFINEMKPMKNGQMALF